MLSLLDTNFASDGMLYRAIMSVVILAITLFVSVVCHKMVHTYPVLGVLLCFAAGIKVPGEGSGSRNVDADICAGFDGT